MLVTPFGAWMQIINEKALFRRTYIKPDKGIFPVLNTDKKYCDVYIVWQRLWRNRSNNSCAHSVTTRQSYQPSLLSTKEGRKRPWCFPNSISIVRHYILLGLPPTVSSKYRKVSFPKMRFFDIIYSVQYENL